jgi:hypothetical protein
LLAAGLIVAAVTEGGWYWWAGAMAAATLALIDLSVYLLTKSALGRPSTFRPHRKAATTGIQTELEPSEPSGMRLKLRLALSRLRADAFERPSDGLED